MFRTFRQKWLIVVFIIALSGCMTFEIETATLKEGDQKAAGSTSETVHGSFWGFMWCDHVVEKSDGKSHGLYRIEYHTNIFHTLASVLSLGLYVPQTVEWWYLTEQRNDEDTDVFDPDSEDELNECNELEED